MTDENVNPSANQMKQEQLIGSYNRFISHGLYKLLGKHQITDVNLGDQVELKLCVLFSDIRGFTEISESLRPKENFDFINSYLMKMTSLIEAHNGIIDKFMGDGIMAVFPTKTDDAVNCSLAMLAALKELDINNYTNNVPLRIGLGLNTGLCMLGIVGGINKMEATVVSDAVNLASRLESLTKVYGVDLLISEGSLYDIEDSTKYKIRFIDRVHVKGKSQPHSIYEIYNNDSPTQKRLKDETKELFEEALAHYHYKNIEKAEESLKKCVEINPNDKPALRYLARCKEFSKNGFHDGAKELNIQIKWGDSYKVGDSEIDQQHIDLFNHSIKLLTAIKEQAADQEINEIIAFLDLYIITHFETEERYLLENDYPFIEHQKTQHLNFIKSFELLKADIMSGSKSKMFMMFRIQTLLIDWVVNHTIKEDKHFAKYIDRKRSERGFLARTRGLTSGQLPSNSFTN